MYNVKNSNNESIASKYIEACTAPERKISIKCIFNGATTLTGDHLISLELSEILNTESNRILLGATPANSVKIKMYMPNEIIPLDGGYLEPYAGIDIGAETVWLPLGKFYVTDVATANEYKTVEITAYDTMSQLTGNYMPNPEYAPSKAINLYTYTYGGNETPGEDYFFSVDTTSYRFTMPQLNIGEKLLFDEFDNTMHIGELDGGEVGVSEGSLGTNLSEFFLASHYHSAYIYDIFEDLKEQARISSSYDLSGYDYRMDVYQNSLTYRELIGYIAGLIGKNAIFDRDANLDFRWYADAKDENDEDVVISAECVYLDGFVRTTDGSLVINSITSGTEENTITVGNGYGISFTNPFMTAKRLQPIYEGIAGTGIMPCTLKYRGMPLLECGDLVTKAHINGEETQDSTIYIMAQTFVIGKGMNASISTYGESEASIAISKSPIDQKLEELYAGLKNSFKDSMETLVGVKGGYFEILYDEITGQPTGWRIMDTPTLTSETKVWTMNKNGLYYSIGGGFSVDNVAIDLNGKINANLIQTGYLTAERIAVENYGTEDQKTLMNYIRFEDGNILLGNPDSEITLKIENNRIAFYDSGGEPLAYFSNDSFAIQSIRKVQISGFAYLTRDNNNLTFTKVD